LHEREQLVTEAERVEAIARIHAELARTAEQYVRDAMRPKKRQSPAQTTHPARLHDPPGTSSRPRLTGERKAIYQVLSVTPPARITTSDPPAMNKIKAGEPGVGARPLRQMDVCELSRQTPAHV
jgi:hypothetical protein